MLSRWVEKLGKEQNFFKDKRIIELGSGAGLTGTVLAHFQHKEITLTDKTILLKLIDFNLEQNGVKQQSVKTETFFWGEKNPFPHEFDVVLGADLTYDFDDLPVLVSALRAVTDKNSVVFIAYGNGKGIIFVMM